MPVKANTSILLLGDSVSAGYGMQVNQSWVYLLNKSFKQDNLPYQIINASISGETTSGGLSRLPDILAKNDVEHLIVELGGNDGLRGLSPKVIKNNLLQIITLAQNKGIKVSLMKIRITPNYGPRYNKMFEQVFVDVAEEKSVALMPFFVEQVALDSELMFDDGIHPNEKAQPIIADFMKKEILALFAE